MGYVGKPVAERGILKGGPFDGKEFPMNEMWFVSSEFREPLLVSHVIVNFYSGDINGAWPNMLMSRSMMSGPPVHIYRRTTDTDPFVFEYSHDVDIAPIDWTAMERESREHPELQAPQAIYAVRTDDLFAGKKKSL